MASSEDDDQLLRSLQKEIHELQFKFKKMNREHEEDIKKKQELDDQIVAFIEDIETKAQKAAEDNVKNNPVDLFYYDEKYTKLEEKHPQLVQEYKKLIGLCRKTFSIILTLRFKIKYITNMVFSSHTRRD